MLGVERTLFVPTNTMANLISGECLPASLSWGLWHWWAHAWISFGCSHWSTPHSVVGGVVCESLPLPSCSSWMLAHLAALAWVVLQCASVLGFLILLAVVDTLGCLFLEQHAGILPCWPWGSDAGR